jgi:hypothetical protein
MILVVDTDQTRCQAIQSELDRRHVGLSTTFVMPYGVQPLIMAQHHSRSLRVVSINYPVVAPYLMMSMVSVLVMMRMIAPQAAIVVYGDVGNDELRSYVDLFGVHVVAPLTPKQIVTVGMSALTKPSLPLPQNASMRAIVAQAVHSLNTALLLLTLRREISLANEKQPNRKLSRLLKKYM